MAPQQVLPVSLVIVSDYQPGEDVWADERAALRAFLDDPAGAPAQIVVMKTAAARPVPDDLAALSPDAVFEFRETTSSAALKDAGTDYCTYDLVAVIEADCLPEPGWLKLLCDAMQQDGSLDAVSSLTHYGDETSTLRVMSLLDRGFILQKDNERRYVHVSNNGALYRKNILERFRYPDDPNPFISGELRIRAMQSAGIRFGIETRARMVHAYGGTDFVADVHRNKGFQMARILRASGDRRSSSALARKVVRRRMLEDMKTVRLAWRHFLRPEDWPHLVATFARIRMSEYSGALSVDDPEGFARSTAYR